MPEEEELTSTKAKIIILGDSGVGKSCLAAALVQGAALTACTISTDSINPRF